MFVLGLTGSIGMGKSTAAAMLRHLGVPVHDADAAVHAILAGDRQAIEAISRRFPGAVTAQADGSARVDRQALGAAVFGDATARRDLEAIIHPRVRAATRAFLEKHARLRTPLVVLDIPLLYETGAQDRVDAVIVVSAPAAQQRQRVMRRPGMSAERFAGILASQLPDAEKRRRADFIVETGLSRAYTFRRLKEIVDAVRRDSAAGGT